MGSSPALALIPHTSSSLLLEIGAYGNGWQGADDEAWGVDSLTITYEPPRANTVPAPLPLLGVGSAFALRRRLRRRLGLPSRAQR